MQELKPAPESAVPSAEPLLSTRANLMNLGLELFKCWTVDKIKTAFVCRGRRISADRLWLLAQGTFTELKSVRVNTGDSVVVLPTDSEGSIASILALHLLGAVPVFAYQDSTPREIAALVRKTKSLAVIGPTRGERPRWLDARVALIDRNRLRVGPSQDNISPILPRDNMAVVFGTSGSTATPKLYAHSIRYVLDQVSQFARYCLELSEDDVVGGNAPLAFSYGYAGLFAMPLLSGCTSVLTPSSPEAILESVEKHRISILFSFPSTYKALLEQLNRSHRDLGSLRCLVSAGSKMGVGLGKDLQSMFKSAMVLEHMGCTESFFAFLSNRVHSSRTGSVGLPVPGYDVAVFNSRFEPCKPSEPGLLAFRGPGGAFRLSARQNGWLRVKKGWTFTGDVAYIDHDGFFWFVARTDEMIKVRSFGVSPLEIEEVAEQHPAVREAAVVGYSGPGGEEKIKIFLAPRPERKRGASTRSSIKEYLRSNLAPYKIPSSIVFLEEIPKTRTGKKLRRVLKLGDPEGTTSIR